MVDVADATADYVRSAALLAPLADYLVVNVSSPNTPGLRGLQAVETLRPLLEAVRDAAGATPLLVKIAPDLADDEVDGDRRARGRAGARRAHRDEHDDLARGPAPPTRRSSRRPARAGCPARRSSARALEVLRLVRAAVPAEFCVISAGGVETADDVRERLDAGATLVQGYTAFLYRGPLWARQINRGLTRCGRPQRRAAQAGCCPRLTCGLGSRMKRIWMMRIAPYQPRPFSMRSAPNFLRAACFTRIDVRTMSPMTKRMKIHRPTNE